MDSLRRLEDIFAKFPGIGPRQARRFAYYLLGKPQSFIKEFTDLIQETRQASSQCAQCQRLFIGNAAHVKSHRSDLCSICSDASRDRSILMIVARDSDFESIEKSGAYRGLYFILGGTIPVLDKEPDKRIRLQALLERVSRTPEKTGGFKEIILSLNTTPDGEHTANVVKEALSKVLPPDSGKGALHPTKVSILGRGLSTGAELEYADGETIKNALENRR